MFQKKITKAVMLESKVSLRSNQQQRIPSRAFFIETAVSHELVNALRNVAVYPTKNYRSWSLVAARFSHLPPVLVGQLASIFLASFFAFHSSLTK